MAERTQRGEEDRKHEDEEMTGEPVEAPPTGGAGSAGTPATNTTRDKGAEPAKGAQRGADKKS